MRIVEYRTDRGAELMATFRVQALIQITRGNGNRLYFPGLPALSRPCAAIRAEFRNPGTLTLDAVNTFRPAHELQVGDALFFRSEFRLNIYQRLPRHLAHT